MKEKMEAIFRTNYVGTEESLTKSLVALKAAGFSAVEIVKLLISELGITLQEADSIVLNSEAWKSDKANILKLRDDFESELLN